jgi:hypothetical protein
MKKMQSIYQAKLIRIVILCGIVAVLFGLIIMPAAASNFTLNINSGDSSTTWFISGEASLIMNGFDLTPLSINLPVRLDQVSIDVASATPGQLIDVVVYQDANGGSPVDATLVGQKQVDITQTGVFTVTFENPVQITAPVIWVGFYLPVDFQFRADTSGSSVLTYWAWQPNARFELSNLSTAGTIGPANGTAPVNINMNGIARITAGLITDGSVITTPIPTLSAITTNTNRILQIVGDSSTSLAPMIRYPFCQPVLYDIADVGQTYQNGIRWFCRVVPNSLSPSTPQGYTRIGVLFDIFVFGVESGVTKLPYPITHCIDPDDLYQDRAVIGLAHGAPRQWEILPTVRYGAFICAEVNYAGSFSAFIPN